MDGIFLDIESNGLNYKKHRVVEIAFKIVDLSCGELKDQYSATIKLTPEEWEKSDPISLKINGLTWDEVLNGRPLELVSEEIISSFKKNRIRRGQSVFICQNPSFDRAFFGQLIDPDKQEALNWPYHWLDLASMYWSLAIRHRDKQPLPWQTGFTKDKIASSYGLDSESMPHKAMNGVDHLILCYQTVVGFPEA